jgi:hypothetical protein
MKPATSLSRRLHSAPGDPRRAVSLVEVSVAATLLACAGLPLMTTVCRSVTAVRVDTLRVHAETLCHNALERLGRCPANVRALAHASTDPATLEAELSWLTEPETIRQLACSPMHSVTADTDLRLVVRLRKGVEPGLDELTCRVLWTTRRGRSSRTSQVSYSRFILHAHLH